MGIQREQTLGELVTKHNNAPAQRAATARYNAQIKALRPIMAAKGWRYWCGMWVAR